MKHLSRKIFASVSIALLCLLVSPQSARAARADSSCARLQRALYAGSSLDIRMVFGYKDARPARFVGDRHERLAFIEQITAPCDGIRRDCEFLRSREDADLFTKDMRIAGSLKKIRLRVVNSSVGTDDEENRSDPFQAWKSREAQESFLSGLEKADVVFYNGHSRFGGGPDFRPPILSAKGTVDEKAYKRHRPGIAKMRAVLEESWRPRDTSYGEMKILGLFSCSSSQHFNEEIHRVSNAAIISTPALMYYSDALTSSLNALNAILDRTCPRHLNF